MDDVSEIRADDVSIRIREFADLLRKCVDSGASIGFLRPLSEAAATKYWLDLLPEVVGQERRVFAAVQGDRIVGSIQLRMISTPNQPHRAELAKLIVQPDTRRSGLGGKLISAAEAVARASGRSLLTLDTAGEEAKALYDKFGYIRCGSIPDYALNADGKSEANVIYYKKL